MAERRSGRWVRATLRYLYLTHGYRCARCGRAIDARLPGVHPEGGTIGHVTALANGGTNEIGNLRPEHNRCNRAAGADDDEPAAHIIIVPSSGPWSR